MLVSAVVSIIIPFELFLISYVILGPLHYLTEIGWLHNKKYFLKDTSIAKPFIIISSLLTLNLILSKIDDVVIFGFNLTKFTNTFYAPFFLFAFITAFIYLYVEDFKLRLKLIIFALLFSYIITQYYYAYLLFGFILPTLIHVYLFTALFILYGAIKNKSTTAFVSVAFLILCTVLLFFDYPIKHQVSISAQQSFLNTNFSGFAYLISTEPLPTKYDFNSTLIIKVQRFVSFAYTYHYLNWFSKTNIIKWHLAPKRFLFTTIIIWIFSICLYLYNYKFGFVFLLFFNVLHIILEFPLNLISIKTVLKLNKN